MAFAIVNHEMDPLAYVNSYLARGRFAPGWRFAPCYSNHSILFTKMEKYGFSSDTTEWFSSYLLNGQQLVSCHNELSGKHKVNIGVPQGLF